MFRKFQMPPRMPRVTLMADLVPREERGPRSACVVEIGSQALDESGLVYFYTRMYESVFRNYLSQGYTESCVRCRSQQTILYEPLATAIGVDAAVA